VRRVRSFSPVVNCDVESLYPSIMLADRIAPASDRLSVFLPMLHVLTQRRLHAKRRERETSGRTSAQWRGIQSSFKVLINSFYGYLGYGRGYLNDYDAAEAVTLRGQHIVQHIVEELERRGAQAIEIDTDGVFFQPPPEIADEAGEEQLIDAINATLSRGIRLALDGRYRGMLSLKLKNYALLGYDGSVILKGSSLRSRREERYLRRFLHDAVVRQLRPADHGSMRDFYLDVAERILAGALPPDDIFRTETITDQTFRSESNRRLADAVEGERVGERIAVYQRADGSIARASNYAGDEDRTYLLRRLRDMADRFRPLYESDAAFDYDFPLISTRTDIQALRAARPVTQLDLFSSLAE
jgi:DNA polymerase I